MRNPGTYSQPFPMFGDFWHASTDNNRADFKERVLYTGLAWHKNAKHGLADVRDRIGWGIVPAGAATEAVAVARTHVHQTSTLLAARYKCMLMKRIGAE